MENLQEIELNGHHAFARAGGAAGDLVYVDNQMVKTNWVDTVALLEKGHPITVEDQMTAMNRVLAAVGIRQ